MTLAPGSRLGAYEILSPLGAGGMGEVYRARDAKLGRDVAIKVLPVQLATNPEALARFEREARAVAALSHPNILAIFDFGSEGERAYAVMELLEGESLRERLREGALGTRKAVEIAAQIAQGLAAAHERGIVHRDLKPDNVFVSSDGRVKILDFGLAKETAGPGSQSQLMAAPTVNPGTEPGAVLGTVGYMAPEQVRGQEADARADLFALGVMLYEMLAGRRAFAHDSSVETMSAILKEEPPALDELGTKIPPALDHVLRRCLEKRREERFQSARDLAFALRDSTGGSAASTPARGVVAESGASGWRWLPAALATAAVIGGIALGYRLGSGRSGEPAPAGSSALQATFRQLTKLPGGEGSPALSPDGGSVVFERTVDGQTDLFLQRVDGQTTIPLTAGCRQDDGGAAFSPDGARIAFRSDCQGGGIFVMGATGENVRRVADFGYSPAWSPDGRELAVSTEEPGIPWNRPSESELWAIAVDSGAKRLVTKADAMHPSWSPSGKRIAFWGLPPGSFSRDLWTAAADGSEAEYGQVVRLTDDPHLDWNPVWSVDGRTLYFASSRGGTFNLWRMPIDEATGKRLGEPEAMTAPSSWAGWLSASRDGRRLAFVDRNIRTTVLRARIDAARGVMLGAPVPVPTGSMEVYDVDLAPDGESLVLSSSDIPQQLYLMNADGTDFRQLTDDPYRNRQGAFAPDGRTLVFQTSRFPGGLALIQTDGSGLRELAHGPEGGAEPVFSSRGRRLAFGGSAGNAIVDLDENLGIIANRPLHISEPGALFYPTSFSPDDELVAGSVRGAGMAVRSAIYSRRDDRWTVVGVLGSNKPKLLGDDGRLVLVLPSAIVVLDGPNAKPRAVVEAAPGHRFRHLSLSHDRRTIAWVDETDESDIWMMTFAEAAGSVARP